MYLINIVIQNLQCIIFPKDFNSAITCSKSAIETLEQGVCEIC